VKTSTKTKHENTISQIVSCWIIEIFPSGFIGVKIRASWLDFRCRLIQFFRSLSKKFYIPYYEFATVKTNLAKKKNILTRKQS